METKELPTLEPHQQQIVDLDPEWFLLGWGGGSGKTATALHLARGKTLVVCPKTNRDDRTWFRDKDLFNLDLDLTVISKEELRAKHETLDSYDTVIVDECHETLGITTDTVIRQGVRYPKTSKLFASLQSYLLRNVPKRFYLVSGTPADKPMKVFAIGVLMKRWDMSRYFEFRDKYYFCKKIGYRELWIPKKTKELQDKLAELINSFGITGRLEDWYNVPPQIHETIYVEATDEQKEALIKLRKTEADPMVIRTKQRAIENGLSYDKEIVVINEKESLLNDRTNYYKTNKEKVIKDIIKERGKTIIFATYTGQIERLAKEIADDGYKVFTLTGKTDSEDRKNIMKDAEVTPDCVVIVQSSISAGWEIKSCRTMIFASKSYRFVDYKQAQWRNLRVSNLDIAYNTYYHIVLKGGIDEMCHDTIIKGEDFYEKIMEKTI